MSTDRDAPEVSLRDQTLKIKEIDEDHISRVIDDKIAHAERDREDYMDEREEWLDGWRDLRPNSLKSQWAQNTSDFKSPYSLTLMKATHARFWDMFQNELNFFGVRARHPAFEEKSQTIRNFMNWVLNFQANDGQGVRDVFDKWIWQIVTEGSGVMKLFWDRKVETYKDVTRITELTEELVFDEENLTGRQSERVETREEEVEKTKIKEFPCLETVLIDDFYMPVGYSDPQKAPWVAQSVFMSDEDMKARAADGKFDVDAVEDSISRRKQRYSSQTDKGQLAHVRADLEGVTAELSTEDIDEAGNDVHEVIEYYGRFFVESEAEADSRDDLKKFPRELVVWMHKESRRILGWTYLHRVSPAGIRPFFKADYMPAEFRPYGIGVAELLHSIQLELRTMHNIRVDNGILSANPWGLYRASSSALKPDKFKIEPGTLFPSDDPNSDIKMMQFPFLSGFMAQEEQNLGAMGERLLAISDLQLGQTGGKGVAGVLRNATGAQIFAEETGRQLQIHFDRIARALDKMLQALFRMSRERQNEELVFRVTGEQGQPVWGEVDRDKLSGEFDFIIQADVFGQSKTEEQQSATLLIQTLLNPAFLQTGVVTPENMFFILQNFLKKHNIKRIDSFITSPTPTPQTKMSTAERLYRIFNGIDDPPIEETVRLDENHERAIKDIEAFKQSTAFGAFEGRQIAAIQALKETHERLLAAQSGGGIPNSVGQQAPTGGFQAVEAAQGGATALPSQGQLAPDNPGEASGPVF